MKELLKELKMQRAERIRLMEQWSDVQKRPASIECLIARKKGIEDGLKMAIKHLGLTLNIYTDGSVQAFVTADEEK